MPPRSSRTALRTSIVLGVAILQASCGGTGGDGSSGSGSTPGVDTENRVVRVAILNDLSGPAAVIGRPMSVGMRMLYQQINLGGGTFLPDGWTVEWVERDHGYNPQQSVQVFNEVRDDVLMLALSFGTPNTLPLVPMLEREGMLAIPASLSSRVGQNRTTPVITPTYRTEAMRAVDWIADQAGPGASIGVVYQQDDYGEDALEGAELEAAHHGLEIVSRQAIAPGQADFTAVVSGLRSAGADHVILAVLPSATGPLLGTAAQLEYGPVWVANSPAWSDRFFDPEVIPPSVFGRYHWVGGSPFWGEELPGMTRFLEAWEAFGANETEPDYYVLTGYLFAAAGIEIVRRALEAGDPTREGLLEAVASIDGWNVHGLTNPISLRAFPYDASRLTRILRPNMAAATWEPVADYSVPVSDGSGTGSGG